MNEIKTALKFEVRPLEQLVITLAGLSLTVLLLFAGHLSGVWDFQLLSQAASNAGVVVAPLCGGLGALVAMRRYDPAHVAQLRGAASHALIVISVQVLLPLTAVGLGGLAGLIFTLLSYQVHNAGGALQIFWIMAAACGVAVAYLLGAVIGLFVRRWFVPPLVSLVQYMFLAFMITQTPTRPWTRRLLYAVDNQTDVFSSLNRGELIAEFMWKFALAVLLLIAILGAVGRLRSRRTVVFAGGATALALVSLVSIIGMNGNISTDTRVPDRKCSTQTAIEVCMVSSYASGLTDVQSIFSRMISRLPANYAGAHRFYQIDGNYSLPLPAGAAGFYAYDLSKETLSSLADEYLYMHDFKGCHGSSDSGLLTQFIAMWVSGESLTPYELSLPPELRAATKRFESWPVNDKRSWLQENWPKVTGCTLSAGDFGR